MVPIRAKTPSSGVRVVVVRGVGGTAATAPSSVPIGTGSSPLGAVTEGRGLASSAKDIGKPLCDLRRIV